MIKYHDEEWGVPVHDDRKQFEFLMLEVMQCGLNRYVQRLLMGIFKGQDNSVQGSCKRRTSG